MTTKIIKKAFILMMVFILTSSSMLWLNQVHIMDERLIYQNRPRAVTRMSLAYTSHDPIVIVSDSNFSDTAILKGWSGDGSSQNPYIIEGLAIDKNNTAGHCISISNTRVNFTIQNCNLTGASINPGSGIYLNNVTYGKIVTNILSNNVFNIYLWFSSYVSILNNNCSLSVYSISLRQESLNNLVANNNCSDNSNRGINIETSSNYNIITNNTCKFNYYGIVLYGVSHNEIANNNCSINDKSHLGEGIHLNGAPSNLIVNNTCNDNYRGIYLFAGSHWCVLRNNTCNLARWGIWLQESNYLQVSNNTCKGTVYEAIDLRLVSYSNVTDNICTENTRAIRVYYGSNNNTVINNYCDNNRLEGIKIDESDFNEVTNNSCNYNQYNIYLDYADYNTVTNNSCKNGTSYSVEMYNSNFNTIANNTGIHCGYGVYMYQSSNNDIMRNEFSECLNGIYAPGYSSNNIISWNNISSNRYTIYCGYNTKGNQISWNAFSTTSTEYGAYDYSSYTGSSNIFDYNYYSEYDGFDADGDAYGDTPFEIEGNPSYEQWWNQDLHPLALPPNASLSWLQPPTNQNYEIGVPFHYDINASSFEGLSNWWINDTTNFNIDHLGIITNTTFLPVGMYSLEVHVNDTIGVELMGSFTVDVSEYAPTWVEEPVDHLIGIMNSFEYDLDAIDPNGLDTWWLNDTANFAINQTGFITNATLLSLGEYGIRVYVNDTHGNVLTGDFKVVVWIYSNHSPIIIDGDDEFHSIASSERWIGDGTAQSPYIIDYWIIDRDNQPGHCISISNTRVFFEIRDCFLSGASVNPGSGIHLHNVTNCMIVNTTCYSNYIGIRIYNSSHVHISSSTIRDNPNSGIWSSDYCYNISLVNNYVQDGGAGFRLYYTFESQVCDNICNVNGYGIYLWNCDFNLVSNNTCMFNTNRGLCLEYSENNTVSDNICDYNTAFGLVLYYAHYNDVTDNSFSYNGNQGIHHRQSDFNNVLRNVCNNNSHGMYIHDYSEYNTITSNLCTGNTNQGVWFRSGSNNNTMTNTTCRYNNYGLYLHADVNNNTILWNVFANNTASNGFDGAIGDLVDYNYWGDYAGIDANDDGVGDTPYNLTQDLNQDIHPLIVPPGRPLEWLTPPTDQIIGQGIAFIYDLDVKFFSFIDLWWINDSTNFWIDQHGTISNATVLQLGVYGIEVSVNDSRGNILSGVFSLTVADLTAPTWLGWLDYKVVDYRMSFYYDLDAYDLNGLDAWWLNDTTTFSIDQNGVITNVTVLSVGNYRLEVFVNDTSGNTLMGILTVRVIDQDAPHGPIIIDGDAEFHIIARSEGWPGDGTLLSPYIIEYLLIDLGGASGDCINISNTEVYFIIRYCILRNANVSSSSGIRLTNVVNGDIENCYSHHNGYGISAVDSSNCTIIDNRCDHNSFDGIYMYGCSDIILSRNNCSLNGGDGISVVLSTQYYINDNICNNNSIGIYFYSSQWNDIVNNTCNHNIDTGISIESFSSDNTISENTCRFNDYGLTIESSSSNNLINDNICTHNIVGIVLTSSSCEIIVNTCSYNTWYGMEVVRSHHVISNNDCNYNGRVGILLNGATNCELSFNICNNNGDHGIHHEESSYNILTNNTCNENNNNGLYMIGYSEFNEYRNNTFQDNVDYGVYLLGSCFNNTFANNTFTDNPCGLYIDAGTADNTIVWNGFIDNVINQAIDNGVTNHISHNYWSNYTGADSNEDGIGDTPHSIPGNVDLFPLMVRPGSPPIWLEPLEDHQIEVGDIFRYDINATAIPPGANSWWLDDVTYFDIDQNGIISNITILPPGLYSIYVSVSDIYGKTLSGLFTVLVEDLIAPIWLITPTGPEMELGQSLFYQLEAWDNWALDTWWLNDSVRFTIDETGVVSTTEVLPVGTYALQVWVNDTSNNILTATFVVTVIDTTPPTIDITSPTTMIYNSNSITLSFSVSEYLASLIIYLDSITNTTALPSDSVITALSDGLHNITIVAIDQSNNVGKATVIFTVDATSPIIIIDTPTPTLHSINTISIDICGDAVHYWYYIVGADSANQTWSSAVQRSLDDGTYTLHAYGNDSAGNEAHRSVIFTIDTSSPTITHPEDVIYEEGTISHTITWSSSDATPASFRITRDGAIIFIGCWWYGESISIHVDGLPVGTYQYTCTVYDQGGHLANDSVMVTVVDTTPPTIDHPADILYMEEVILAGSITWEPSDPHPASYSITMNDNSLESGSWDGSSITVSFAELASGNYTFTCTVWDQSGNSVSDSVLVSVLPKPSQAPWPPLILSLGAIGLAVVLRQSRRKTRR